MQFKAISPAFPVNDAFSYPTYKMLRQQTQVLAGALAFRKLHQIDFEVDGHSALVEGQLVSGNYFSMLGVRAIRGRTILPVDESVAGQSPVAVIGYDYWRSRFGLDPQIVGKKILLNNAAYTIVGVTQPEFYGLQPGERIDVSVPLTTIALVRPGFRRRRQPLRHVDGAIPELALRDGPAATGRYEGESNRRLAAGVRSVGARCSGSSRRSAF